MPQEGVDWGCVDDGVRNWQAVDFKEGTFTLKSINL
jgi:hypothetical protein